MAIANDNRKAKQIFLARVIAQELSLGRSSLEKFVFFIYFDALALKRRVCLFV